MSSIKIWILLLTLGAVFGLAYLWGSRQDIASHEVIPLGKTVELSDTTGRIRMDIEEFLPLTVMAVWDIDDNDELIKMQFVIMRTWLLFQMQDKQTLSLPETGGSDQIPWISYKELKEKWGSRYVESYDRLRWLQASTAHEVLLQNDSLIVPYFHAVSAGATVDGKAAYGKTYGYLPSVESAWDLTAPNFLQVRCLPLAPLLAALSDIHPEITTTVTDFFDAFSIEKKDDTGYVLSVRLGNVSVSGAEFARVCGFASPCFTLEKYPNAEVCTVRITTKGNGSGLGVSLYGAAALADSGKNYKEILNYFYKNVEIGEQ